MPPQTPPPRIRLATAADIPALLALEARYFVGNLAPEARAEGFLSVLHGERWFGDSVRAGEIHVAEADGTVAGFIAVKPPPSRDDPGLDPISRALFDVGGRRYHFLAFPFDGTDSRRV